MAKAKYDPSKIEKKWQKAWQKHHLHSPDLSKAKKPFYNLMMFPYPSGAGLHVGHVYAFSGADTFGRFMRRQGFDVFEPMGFDAFGIHGENYALQLNKHPKEVTAQTTAFFRDEQLSKLGIMFDWSREINTTLPEYYQWNQWLFLEFLKAGLAERKKAAVNWCPSCKTVLADEQAAGGHCERCESIVEKREIAQWFFKITEFAEELNKGLAKINWSENVKKLQAAWIGRSEGAVVNFWVPSLKKELKVFTTRPDTIFGVTYVAIAPEHAALNELVIDKERERVEAFLKKSEARALRGEKSDEKHGVFTGTHAINPLSGALVPIWISDYVLAHYGGGAIMGVPAHDQRDFNFATKYQLPIESVIQQANSSQLTAESYEGEGELINSGDFSDLQSTVARAKIIAHLKQKKQGKKVVTYRLRDWLISRQRYWGTPIPVIYCHKCLEAQNPKSEIRNKSPNTKYQILNTAIIDGKEYAIVPVPKKDLPVKLPEIDNFRPQGTGKSPLASIDSFVNTQCPQCGSAALRETDVMDNFIDSSWYFYRYTSTEFNDVAFSSERVKKWLPVDMYIGGAEHSVLHLLYTRFVTLALHKLGHVPFEDPFKKFRSHGLITKDGAKMSKSKGNVVNPNAYIQEFGADALRVYLLFLGPYDQGGDFSDTGIKGATRFLERIWNICTTKKLQPTTYKLQPAALAEMHKTIKAVTDDISSLRFNTAIAKLMTYVNFLQAQEKVSQKESETLLGLVAPLAPHLAEEIYQKQHASKESIKQFKSIHDSPWPKYDKKYLVAKTIKLAVQVNGKTRDVIEADTGLSEAEVKKLALESQKVAGHIVSKIVKTIYIKDRLINFVQ